MNPFLARLLFVLFICAFFALTASAQITEATLKISVTDSLQSPIAGTYADILNEDTNEKRIGTTDGNGQVTFSSVPPGRYTVCLKNNGFKMPKNIQLVKM